MVTIFPLLQFLNFIISYYIRKLPTALIYYYIKTFQVGTILLNGHFAAATHTFDFIAKRSQLI